MNNRYMNMNLLACAFCASCTMLSSNEIFASIDIFLSILNGGIFIENLLRDKK